MSESQVSELPFPPELLLVDVTKAVFSNNPYKQPWLSRTTINLSAAGYCTLAAILRFTESTSKEELKQAKIKEVGKVSHDLIIRHVFKVLNIDWLREKLGRETLDRLLLNIKLKQSEKGYVPEAYTLQANKVREFFKIPLDISAPHFTDAVQIIRKLKGEPESEVQLTPPDAPSDFYRIPKNLTVSVGVTDLFLAAAKGTPDVVLQGLLKDAFDKVMAGPATAESKICAPDVTETPRPINLDITRKVTLTLSPQEACGLFVMGEEEKANAVKAMADLVQSKLTASCIALENTADQVFLPFIK